MTLLPEPVVENSDSQILLSHDVSSTSISSEVVMVDEDTRMSAETNSRSETPAKQVRKCGNNIHEINSFCITRSPWQIDKMIFE